MSETRCDRCNEIHDQSDAALAMCRAAAAMLDEWHRPGLRLERFAPLVTSYQHAYTAWKEGSA